MPEVTNQTGYRAPLLPPVEYEKLTDPKSETYLADPSFETGEYARLNNFETTYEDVFGSGADDEREDSGIDSGSSQQ